jgi:hypothetical protein
LAALRATWVACESEGRAEPVLPGGAFAKVTWAPLLFVVPLFLALFSCVCVLSVILPGVSLEP